MTNNQENIDKKPVVKKRRLKKKYRVIRAKLILGLVILSMAIPLYNKVIASVNEPLTVPENYEEVVVTILEGDRAWNIQERLTPNEDIREVLHYVNIVNDKSVGTIKPGEQIIFYQIKDNK